MDGGTIWMMHATHGFPLELSIPMLADRDQVPDWVGLIRAALRDGVNLPGLLRRLDAVVGDSYEATTAAAIRQRLTKVPDYLTREGG